MEKKPIKKTDESVDGASAAGGQSHSDEPATPNGEEEETSSDTQKKNSVGGEGKKWDGGKLPMGLDWANFLGPSRVDRLNLAGLLEVLDGVVDCPGRIVSIIYKWMVDTVVQQVT